MMDLTPKLAEGASLIASYGEGGFTIANVRHEGPVFVEIDRITPWPQSSEPLSEATLAPMLASCEGLEILLIGTGKTHQFVSPALREALKKQFCVSIETMDTGAACRTFNILLAEGRIVAAALQAV